MSGEENRNEENHFDYRSSGGAAVTGVSGVSNSAGFDYRLDDPMDDNISIENDENNVGIEIGYMPPDQRPGLPGELLANLVDPAIDEDTEAAEALRQNANVRVGRLGKVARGVGAQSVRKVLKVATLRGGGGNRRGKPPRVPPGLMAQNVDDDGAYIYTVGEDGEYYEDGEYDDQNSVGSAGQRLKSAVEHHQLDQDSYQREQESAGDDHHSKHSTTQGDKPSSGKAVRVRDEESAASPSRGDTSSKNRKDARHSSIMEEAKDIPAEVVAATMEAGRKLMGALDPHNMLQLQRWRRKKKHGEKKKRKSYVKGKVIDGRHELYTLSIAMMLGLRTSIARTNTIISSSDRRNMLNAQDFMAEEKYEFSPKGSATTPPHKLSHTFKFKDYAPVAFAYLRRMFGVNEFDFLLSVCGNANFIEFISNAKSGQFFFYSSDGKYMIKTMTNAESKFLRRILPHYFRHCTQNPNTLMTKFLGMYRVKLYHLRRNVKFVVMNSVYYTDKSLQTFFDLKGSEIGRDAKPGQEVLKDNDLRRQLPDGAVCVDPEVRERLRKQIVSDCRFLRQMQIMDYSMLIGIHHIPPKEEAHKHGNIAETGLRIKERQMSHRAGNFRQGSHSKDQIQHAAAAAKKADENGDLHGSLSQGSSHEAKRNSLRKDSKVGLEKGDSTKKLITDIRESTHSGANFEFAGLLDEEDDCSYLEGSKEHADHKRQMQSSHRPAAIDEDVEFKKEQTIEQIYWPFHRFFDINGLRRMKPKPCFRCNTTPCTCHTDLVKAWRIPDFEPPLSNRKDGGLVMDTTGMKMPMVFHGPQGDRPYEGKVFFLGIIDILQQYNGRKRLETPIRRIQYRGALEPSCVSPDDYADRFIRFFDEYSIRDPKLIKTKGSLGEEKTEVETK